MNFISNYESWMDELLPKILARQHGAFIDVGANIGQTMLKVLPNHEVERYYAVEPNTYCAEYLESVIVLNNFQNTEIIKDALSDTIGKTKLLLRYRDDILATTSPAFRKYTKYSSSLIVPQTTGDLLFETIAPDNIAVIKIDVEGGELNVLKGFTKTIKAHQPFLLLEVLPLHSKDASVARFRLDNAKGILSLLDALSYSLYNVRLKTSVKSISDLSTSLESSNYLAIPKGKSVER